MDVTSSLADVVHHYYEDIDAGDVPAALTCFAPDAVYRRPGYAQLNGLASIERFYQETRLIERGEHTVDVIIERGDEVAVRGSMRGVAKDGTKLSVRFADFWRFSERLVIERNTYFDAAAV